MRMAWISSARSEGISSSPSSISTHSEVAYARAARRWLAKSSSFRRYTLAPKASQISTVRSVLQSSRTMIASANPVTLARARAMRMASFFTIITTDSVSTLTPDRRGD